MKANETPKNDKYTMESTKTAIIYVVNIVFMILMCIFILGILLIYLVVYLEGSLYVNPMILAHMVFPSFVLGVNLYMITLEDR